MELEVSRNLNHEQHSLLHRRIGPIRIVLAIAAFVVVLAGHVQVDWFRPPAPLLTASTVSATILVAHDIGIADALICLVTSLIGTIVGFALSACTVGFDLLGFAIAGWLVGVIANLRRRMIANARDVQGGG